MLYQVKIYDAKLRVKKIFSSKQIQARADENFKVWMEAPIKDWSFLNFKTEDNKEDPIPYY